MLKDTTVSIRITEEEYKRWVQFTARCDEVEKKRNRFGRVVLSTVIRRAMRAAVGADPSNFLGYI
jgi:hypothetical protein